MENAKRKFGGIETQSEVCARAQPFDLYIHRYVHVLCSAKYINLYGACAQVCSEGCKYQTFSKIIVSPKEIQLSISIGTFLTNYDVTYRKLQPKMREKYSNGDYLNFRPHSSTPKSLNELLDKKLLNTGDAVQKIYLYSKNFTLQWGSEDQVLDYWTFRVSIAHQKHTGFLFQGTTAQIPLREKIFLFCVCIVKILNLY